MVGGTLDTQKCSTTLRDAVTSPEGVFMRVRHWSPGCCPDLKLMGLSICHCSVCHETFSAISSFDTHKLMDGCRPPRVCGLIQGENRVWHWPPKASLIKWLAKV